MTNRALIAPGSAVGSVTARGDLDLVVADALHRFSSAVRGVTSRSRCMSRRPA